MLVSGCWPFRREKRPSLQAMNVSALCVFPVYRVCRKQCFDDSPKCLVVCLFVPVCLFVWAWVCVWNSHHPFPPVLLVVKVTRFFVLCSLEGMMNAVWDFALN